jgi:methionyl-tRNA formyltransferase
VQVVWVSFDIVGRRALEAAADSGADIVGVVTLPGDPSPDRSGQCRFDEVAGRLGAQVIESSDINDSATLDAIRRLAPDSIFVVGWSQLVRDELIALAPQGVFGMHPTLLPRHRGRAPVPWAILSGLAATGVTLFEIVDPTADSGPVVGQVEVAVHPDDTATTLYERLAEAHEELMRQYVPALIRGDAPRLPQDESRASAWPKRTPSDGIIDWNTRAPYLYDWVRAQTRPYPGAYTFLDDTRVVVWRASAVPDTPPGAAGQVVEERESGVVVACGEGGLLLEEIQADGAEPVAASAVAGALPVGARLG